MKMRAALVVSLIGSFALSAAGCAGPSVTDGARVHEEDGITGIVYEADRLAELQLAEGERTASFDLGEHAFARGFDRVGIRWEAITAGGNARLEVEADGSGTWIPVTTTHEELVPESGTTLYAGHADLPAQATAIRGRLVLERQLDSLGAASPEVRGLELQAFVAGEIAELSDPTAPETLFEGDGETPSGFAAFTAPTIVSRETWGAKAPKCQGSAQSPYRLTFHHTVTTNGETGAAARARMRQMQAYHQNSLGWCDIGYHFSIDAAGKIYRARTTTTRTASHVANQNSGNVGISLMGDYQNVTPPAAQLSGLADALAWMADTYSIAVNDDKIRGHRQWSGQSTSCPGAKTLAKKSSILAGVTTRLNGGATQTPPPPPASAVIVDNPSTGFAASSNWWTSSSQSDRFGTNYRVRSAGSVGDAATWNASLTTRNYEVFVWYAQGANRASEAPFLISHRAGTTKKLVNQRVNGGRWVSLGTYGFDAGTTQRVALSCWTSSGEFVVADAVKFEPR